MRALIFYVLAGSDAGTSNLPGGVTLRTGGAAPRAAYARVALSELRDVDNRACPVVAYFWQNSAVSNVFRRIFDHSSRSMGPIPAAPVGVGHIRD
ncbi:UNVERIFIED_CONTAM: hypothetical protein Sradi_7245700 [Sesamum radiatum]|uniref:Uncharacterized protein n=1 Tax=Sesamum radiatum TaxID=300843 RepID=A0AAW2IME3_SESRA